MRTGRIKRITGTVLSFIMCITMFCGCSFSDKRQNFHDDENIIDDKYGNCYQIFVYSFCDSNGDGIGDLNGITSKLDYIKDLGFTSIWLSPIHKSSTYHKYDVIDYYSIDSKYGTMEDFEALVAACDELGIDIYMDYVINHTSARHEWFVKAKEYLATLSYAEDIDVSVCPYADYYNFEMRDSCPSGWAKVPNTDNWYYECVFWDQMPDLNLYNEEVRKEIERNVDFWIEKGVKGFRLDAALHFVEGNTTESTEILKWFVDYVKSVDENLYCVAEVWSSLSTLESFYESGIDSLFNFNFGNKDGLLCSAVKKSGNGEAGKKLTDNVVKMYETFKAINHDYVDGVFASNHDTGRLAGFLGRDLNKLKLAAGIQLMQTGCVFVYYGEELGMVGSGADENKRAPMYWSDEEVDYATNGPPNYQKQEHVFGSYETQKDDKYSLYNYYRNALHIRNKYPAIGRGVPAAMDDVTAQNGNIYAVSKTYNDDKLCILFNNSDTEITVTVSKDTYGYEKITDTLTVSDEKPSISGESITIPGYCGVVLQ